MPLNITKTTLKHSEQEPLDLGLKKGVFFFVVLGLGLKMSEKPYLPYFGADQLNRSSMSYALSTT